MCHVRDWFLFLFVQRLLLLLQCVYGSSNITVFEDRLAQDWSYKPWDSATRESAGPGPVHSGKYALRVQFFKATAGLALQIPADNALDTTQYAGVEFWGFGGPKGAPMQFLVYQDARGEQRSKSINFELRFGAWKRFYFTMNQLGNPNQIANLVWQSAATASVPTHFYLDDIVVVGGGASIAMPEPLLTVQPSQVVRKPSPNLSLTTPSSSCANGAQFTYHNGFTYDVDALQYDDTRTLDECAMQCVKTHACQSASFKSKLNLCALYTTKTLPPQNQGRRSSRASPQSFREEGQPDVEQSSGYWQRCKRAENDVSKFKTDSDSVYIYGCKQITTGSVQPSSQGKTIFQSLKPFIDWLSALLSQ